MESAVPEDLNALRVRELQDLCRMEGLPIAGRKAEIILRLQEHFSQKKPSSRQGSRPSTPLLLSAPSSRPATPLPDLSPVNTPVAFAEPVVPIVEVPVADQIDRTDATPADAMESPSPVSSNQFLDQPAVRLLHQPITTLVLAFEQAMVSTSYCLSAVQAHKKKLMVLCLLGYICWLLALPYEQAYALDLGYWVFLGILSSVGFGFGLHTFVLFLGPFIAFAALKAASCGSLDFDLVSSVPMMDRECGTKNVYDEDVPFLQMWMKVAPQALAWGIGTAIGELPPYFLARGAARPDAVAEDSNWVLKWISSHLTFFNIMLFASIPNPLFDAAGLACGANLVPFWTFFGATLLGKAVFKANMQACFVIFMVRPKTVKYVISLIATHHEGLATTLDGLIQHEMHRFRSGSAVEAPVPADSWLATGWNALLAVLIGLFVVALIDNAAQMRQEAKAKKQR